MPTETRACQNCKQSFVIEPEDFDFYKRIPVPPPTFCPECRMQRRFAWRNERTLFRNTCAATGKNIITGFTPDSGMVVYERDYWWSDAWDPLAFGQTYDFGRPFFAQFKELLHRVPMPSVFNARTTNVNYANYTGEYKDGYMVSASWEGENVAYGSRANSVKDCVDVFALVGCSLCYEDVGSEKLYNTHFSQECENCTDSWFLYACKGCTNCFGCTNLRNKSYCIFNQPYSKEKYAEKLRELNVGSYTALLTAQKRYEELKSKAIRKYANILNSKNVTGDRISHAADSKFCFDVFKDVRNCKYLVNSLEITDSYDDYGAGAHAELLYEVFDSGVQGMRQLFSGTIYGGANISYSFNCHGCNNLFGCLGLRNKEYCIFNTQYSKEEFEALKVKIIAHMEAAPYVDAKGREYRYGEFFPIEISPFAYNETVAQDYFPLTPAEAAQKGFLWREPERSSHTITKKASELSDDIKDVHDDIFNDAIACAACGRAYRIIPQELTFLRRVGIPLPRECPECRYRRRFSLVNLPRLYGRPCMCKGGQSAGNATAHFHGDSACPNKFETSYAHARPEIIYCEQCYNAEVV
ncbi:MAG: hypothetical protein ABSC29_04095 [Minisyncoccia bacterium]|jgi:hypothetical protein